MAAGYLREVSIAARRNRSLDAVPPIPCLDAVRMTNLTEQATNELRPDYKIFKIRITILDHSLRAANRFNYCVILTATDATLFLS
jgi:hypothetical protein